MYDAQSFYLRFKINLLFSEILFHLCTINFPSYFLGKNNQQLSQVKWGSVCQMIQMLSVVVLLPIKKLRICKRLSIRSCDSLSLVIPNNKTIEHWRLKVLFYCDFECCIGFAQWSLTFGVQFSQGNSFSRQSSVTYIGRESLFAPPPPTI